MIPKILFLVEQIRPRTTQVDDLRTSIPILLQPRTLKAVERVRDTFATADYALVLVVAEGALVANAHQGCWTDVAVANWTLSVALVAKSADRNACCLAAHY